MSSLGNERLEGGSLNQYGVRIRSPRYCMFYSLGLKSHRLPLFLNSKM